MRLLPPNNLVNSVEFYELQRMLDPEETWDFDYVRYFYSIFHCDTLPKSLYQIVIEGQFLAEITVLGYFTM